jgi:hypothetical protein
MGQGTQGCESAWFVKLLPWDVARADIGACEKYHMEFCAGNIPQTRVTKLHNKITQQISTLQLV